MNKCLKTTKWILDSSSTALTCISLLLTIDSLMGNGRSATRYINIIKTFLIFSGYVFEIIKKRRSSNAMIVPENAQQNPPILPVSERIQHDLSYMLISITAAEFLYIGGACITVYLNGPTSNISLLEGVFSIFAVTLPYLLNEFRQGLPWNRRDPIEMEDAFATWIRSQQTILCNPRNQFEMEAGETKRAIKIQDLNSVTEAFNTNFGRNH